MKTLVAVFLLLLLYIVGIAQTRFSVNGRFPQVPNAVILLKGHTGGGDTLLSKGNADAAGQFVLHYPSTYTGAALLEIIESKSVIILLNHENFKMQWDNIEDINTLKFTGSPENMAFADGIITAQNAEGKLAGLKYLLPLYATDLKKSEKELWIVQEIKLQEKTFPDFLNALPDGLYARYYLNVRKFLQDMPTIANRSGERLPAHEVQFNSMDFLDKRLQQSGLYQQLLMDYFKLMESHGGLPEVYKHVNASTDALLKSLDPAPELKEQTAEYLFKLFEQRSLYGAAEHLALAMLADNCHQMDVKHTALFEQYRKMAKGNIAPELKFENTKSGPSQLSDLKNTYKLVVFGSSWCPACVQDIPKLEPFYKEWKTKNNLEVIFISLDTVKQEYESFVKNFPWISSCDFKGWEGQAARDYCVFGTPTMFLLDSENKIVLKPVSPGQINAWLKVNEHI